MLLPQGRMMYNPTTGTELTNIVFFRVIVCSTNQLVVLRWISYDGAFPHALRPTGVPWAVVQLCASAVAWSNIQGH